MHIHCESSEDLEYIKYLNDHISNTYRSFLLIKQELCKDIDNFPNISSLDNQIRNHDKSKYSKEEWSAYRNKFYPTEDKPADEQKFDEAWLHHQHNNPHHWQHWVLFRDSGDLVGLDMPINYVIEMLCDWHSFSAKNPESTAYIWWQDNRHKMTMSDNTIATVEKYIELFKNPL